MACADHLLHSSASNEKETPLSSFIIMLRDKQYLSEVLFNRFHQLKCLNSHNSDNVSTFICKIVSQLILPILTFFGINGNILTKRPFPSPIGGSDPGCDSSAVVKALQIVLAGCP